MSVALRPMSLGEILDRTFQIYRGRFWVFFGLAGLAAIPLTALQAANAIWWGLSPAPWQRSFILGVSPQALIYSLAVSQLSLLFVAFTYPAFAHASSEAILQRHPNMRQSFRRGFSRRWSLIGVVLTGWSLVALFPTFLGFVLLAGFFYFAEEVLKLNWPDWVGPASLFSVTLLGWICALRIGAAISLSAPSWMIESLKVRASIRRGRSLSRHSRVRIIAAWGMPAILQGGLIIGLNEALALMRASCFDNQLFIIQSRLVAFSHWTAWCVPNVVVESIRISFEMLISMLLTPIYPIALTLLYYDQRIRKEGFDIEWMMQSAGMEAESVAAVESAAREIASVPVEGAEA